MLVVGESLWTTTDVARFLSLTEKIANWLGQSAQIPAFKVGLREAEIWNWLEEHCQRDAAGAKKEAKRSRRRRAK
jgi:hypothetical protein